jgi:hypothetical protein
MIKKEENRAKQLPIEKQYIKGVSLIDIDTTISEYMSTTIIPTLEENGNTLKVPLLYGNAERWTTARKEGYLRDQRGKIQVPLIMFKRNSIERDSNLQFFNENLFIPTYKKYSTKNRYDRFSLMRNTQPSYEMYNVRVPEYVTVTYEVQIWTNFTEHMNKIVEAFQWATDRYWGTEDKFKFRTRIESFDTQQEVGEGSERIIRTSFTMTVNAYLLPEKYADTPTVKKEYSAKRLVLGIETDLTGTPFTTNINLYNEYSNIIDFIAIRGSQLAQFVDGVTAKLTNVELPILPPELVGSFDTLNWFRVYINGVFITPDAYTYVYNSGSKEIVFTFTLPFQLDGNDEIGITGKFLEL